jgi:hypothetical protein
MPPSLLWVIASGASLRCLSVDVRCAPLATKFIGARTKIRAGVKPGVEPRKHLKVLRFQSWGAERREAFLGFIALPPSRSALRRA